MLSGLNHHLLPFSLYTLLDLPDIDDGVTIDDKAYLVVAIDIENDGLVAGRDKGCVETGREVLKVHARGKDGVAAIAEHDGRGEVDGGSGGTLHLGIVIIGGLHATVAQRCFQLGKATLEDFVARQSATTDEACLRSLLLDAFEGRDGARGETGVVAPHHHGVDSVGTKDGNWTI